MDAEPVAELPATSDPAADTAAFWRIAAFLLLCAILDTFVDALTGEKTTFLFKDTMHLSPGDIGTIGILTGLPAYVQPFLGARCDLFPLFGSHRRSYYVLGALGCAAALWGLACLHQYPYAVVVCLLLLTGAGGTLASVMVNAVMVAVGNRTRRFGQLQSLLIFVPAVLSIVYTARFGGYVTQHWSYGHAFGLGAFLLLLEVPLALLIDERHAVRDDGCPGRDVRREERIRTTATLKEAARSPGLWAVIGFVFYLIATPGPDTPQIFFETDVLHFSKQFIGSLDAYSSAGSIGAMLVFAATSRRLPARVLVWGAWLMDCLSYPALLLLHSERSAEVLAILGACVGTWYALCLNMLAARACPAGVEGTIFGLVMSVIAIAGDLSDKIGGNLYDYFGPLNATHHWTLTHGWNWSLWIGLALTLVGFVFIPFLPAWAKSREPIE